MGTFDGVTREQKSFSDFELAIRARDALTDMAEQRIGPVQPNGQIGRVVKVDNVGKKAKVWFPGDEEPVEVNLLAAIIPVEADYHKTNVYDSKRGWGARVWVEKLNGKSYITAVLSGGTLSNRVASFQTQNFADSPIAGIQGNSFGVQTGSTVSLIVPNPPQNQVVTFGPMAGVVGGSFIEITIKDVRFSTTKTYQFSGLASFNAAFSNETWYKVPPIRTNGPLDFFTDIGDFDLEIGNTWFISQWDMSTNYMMALRIRRKNDNNVINGELNGYQIIMRSHFGVETLQNETGFFPFEVWFSTVAEPTDIYGTTDYSYTLGMPNVGPYDSAAMDFPRRIQWGLSGPSGWLTFDGVSLKWSGSFRLEGAGGHPHTLTSAYATIDMPANGTVINVIGSSTVIARSVTATGILLDPGEALYYNIRMGKDSASDSSRWIIVMGDGTKVSQVPPYWILIAVRSGLDTSTNGTICLRLGTGDLLDRWHKIGDTGEPAFANSWVDYNTGTRRAGFRKESNQVVRLYGMIKNGTVGSAAFTLPVGYRPVGPLLCSTMSGSAAGRVDVLTNGQVTPIGPSVNSWVSLDGITFLAEG